MGIAGKIGDYTFKAFTATLGITTIYLTGTFSVNVYKGLAWHKAQSVTLFLSLNAFYLIQLLCFNLHFAN
ncbi:transmembrane protein, putative [Medicago truncatula]|uniref:Transmembrane protein, putative n=1 Tax=Medicago truncatula TaxID=3880 RepID=A0A072UPZ5_MEDTR|nr:transmembrane protein, putative [Medicago truncatula]